MDTKNNGLAKSLWSLAGEYKGKLMVSVLFALIGVIGGFIPFLAVAKIINNLIEETSNSSVYFTLGMIAAIGFVIKILFLNLSTSISHKATFNALKDIRKRLITKLSKLPMGRIIETPSGYFKDIIVDRVESLEVTLAHLLPEITANILGPIALIVYLFILDFRMALVALISIPIGMIFMSIMMKPYAKNYKQSVEIGKKMNQTIVEYVGGIEVIKTFNQSAKSYEKYTDSVNNNANFFFKWMKSALLPMSAYMAICPSTLIGVLPVGYLFFMNGSLSSADFITIIIISLASIAPLMTSLNYTDSLAIAGTIVSEIESVLQAKELVRPTQKVILQDLTIQLQNVDFSYDEKRKVLNHINLTIKQGEVTALVGPSGSGKSTIAKLIAGLWDTTSGGIFLGQTNLMDIPLEQLNEQIAYVAQDNYLFDDTIIENIRMGKQNATDEAVIEISKLSGCDTFICKLQDGYQTKVGGGGAHLSGGERQRISIARAMLKDAPIIILDEATSYTDPENEVVIQQSISKLTEGKTLIVIAHRLSTIIDADQIIVVNKGFIEATSNHSQLLEKSEVYREMWNAHIGGKDGMAK